MGSAFAVFPSASASERESGSEPEASVCTPESVPVADYQIRNSLCLSVIIHEAPPGDCPPKPAGFNNDPNPQGWVDARQEQDGFIIEVWLLPAPNPDGTPHAWLALCTI